MTDVKGYTPLSEEKIALASEGKELEERYLRWLEKVDAWHGDRRIGREAAELAVRNEQARLLALGKTNIQQGAMWAIRSIFQPQRIKLPEDVT